MPLKVRGSLELQQINESILAKGALEKIFSICFSPLTSSISENWLAKIVMCCLHQVKPPIKRTQHFQLIQSTKAQPRFSSTPANHFPTILQPMSYQLPTNVLPTSNELPTNLTNFPSFPIHSPLTFEVINYTKQPTLQKDRPLEIFGTH